MGQSVHTIDILGWRGYTWSAVVRPVGHTAKFSKMLTNRDVNTFLRNELFVCMEHLWDLLFQLMVHETNTSHVECIFCSVCFMGKNVLYVSERCTLLHCTQYNPAA